MTQYQKISGSGGRDGDKICYKFSVLPSQDVTSQRTLAALLAQNSIISRTQVSKGMASVVTYDW